MDRYVHDVYLSIISIRNELILADDMYTQTRFSFSEFHPPHIFLISFITSILLDKKQMKDDAVFPTPK